MSRSFHLPLRLREAGTRRIDEASEDLMLLLKRVNTRCVCLLMKTAAFYDCEEEPASPGTVLEMLDLI